MTELVFILGKNWILSIAELLVFLETRGIHAKISAYSRNGIILDFYETIEDTQIIEIQSALGGCYKIGRVITTYPISVVERAFPLKRRFKIESREILKSCPWTTKVWSKVAKKRIKFGVSTYPLLNESQTVDMKRFTLGMNEWVKKKLLSQGAKRVVYYAYDEPDKRVESRFNTALWPKSITKHGLLKPPNAEILAVMTEDFLYLARTVAIYDSQLQQYRDESRPYISSEISTSPKICRTLLNLAGARPGDTVLDPFCGTGTLLMEASLLDMKVRGVDINGDAVEGARKNLIWLGKDLGKWIDFEVVKGDSRNLASLIESPVDAVAFEPTLGPVFKEKPTEKIARKTVKELTDLYREVLMEIATILKPNGRVAMTVPVINSQGAAITIPLQDMVRETGFELIQFLPSEVFLSDPPRSKKLRVVTNRSSISERRWGQIVQRKLVMFGRV